MVAGCSHVDGLQKQRVRERLAQKQYALVAHGTQQLIGRSGLGQKHHARVGLFHGGSAQLMAKLIGQRRVDHDEFKIRF